MAGDLAALSTVNAFNDLARRASDKASETLSLIWEAGKVAKDARASIPHGEWMSFVERHYDVSHDTVMRWVKFHENVPESKLRNVRNLTAGLKMIEESKKSSDKGKPGGVSASASLEANPVESGPASESTAASELARDHLPETGGEWADNPETAPADSLETGKDGRTDADGTDSQETTAETPRNGTEPTEGPADSLKTQRSKTVKTAEALMRAFDDLNELSVGSLSASDVYSVAESLKKIADQVDVDVVHSVAISLCKAVLRIARGWK